VTQDSEAVNDGGAFIFPATGAAVKRQKRRLAKYARTEVLQIPLSF
jgi:hypothetical protein